MRGVAVALVVLMVIFFVVDPERRWLALAALMLAGLALFRFSLFGRDYGRELFVQFLVSPPGPVAAAAA